jgi:fructose-1,6-bisphosphatase/sedoheptulose 1,7-bisphosphatase-like protein
MIKVGGIELYMGPVVLCAPDDLDAVVSSFIDEATNSLAIAVQEIDSEPIARRIIAAKQRGVQVRVILEGDYLVEETARPDPWVVLGIGGTNEGNRQILNAFLLHAST